ncbi:hypothetical protein NQZ68_005843 [Dissostichus eleginoides]|nr:hypothetical protein NQZ68_005843 [Dissostichus eleginoides]
MAHQLTHHVTGGLCKGSIINRLVCNTAEKMKCSAQSTVDPQASQQKQARARKGLDTVGSTTEDKCRETDQRSAIVLPPLDREPAPRRTAGEARVWDLN